MLRVHQPYQLSGLVPRMWDNAHSKFGRPVAVAAIYLGAVSGARTWHVFEVWYERKECGVLLMSAADLALLTVVEIP